MPSSNDTLPTVSAFQHPLVRDLCWTLSPQFDLLLDLPPHQRFVLPQSAPTLVAWLNVLEQNPQPLEAFMAEHLNRRLGHYFERLVLFYLRHAPQPRMELLKHNLPIYGHDAKGHKITLGELDFLLKTDDHVLHLETAVKFYLGVEMAGKSHWIGPGLSDRFHRKLQHLRDRQLPLSQILNLDNFVERAFWVKGLIFHPWANTLPLLPGIATAAEPSYWLTQSEALRIVNKDWLVLAKPRWLGGENDAGENTHSTEKIREHFAAHNRVLMLSHKHTNRRLLIVPDDWPGRARIALGSEA